MRSILSVAALASALASVPAEAAWNKAESRHFVVYGEMKAAELSAFAEKLERFDAAARRMLKVRDPEVGDGNRVHLYMVKDFDDIDTLIGVTDTGIAGFYIPRYSGAVAFIPREGQEDDKFGAKSSSIFFHEYSHHLMFQQASQPYPKWFVEGFAELIGTPRFGDDGSVTLGIPAKHRAKALQDYGRYGFTTTELVATRPKEIYYSETQSIYARGWLLTHYLTFSPERSGQLKTYLDALAKEVPSTEAAARAFGDLRKLDREITSYMRRPRLPVVTVSGTVIKPGPVKITPLSDAAGNAMMDIMLSRLGVKKKEQARLTARLRPVAASMPNDIELQTAIAEAELDSDQPEAALAAADRAIALDPKKVQAYVYRGRALLKMAVRAKDSGIAAKARQAFIAGNKLDSEDPEPLFEFFQSYKAMGSPPTANAYSALHYAAALAPGDDIARIHSAMAWIDQGQMPKAREQLLSLALDPHGGKLSEAAKTAVDRIGASDGKGATTALANMLAERDKQDERGSK